MEEDLAKELRGLKSKPEVSPQADSTIKKDASSTFNKQEGQKILRQPGDSKQQLPHAVRKMPTTIGKMIDKRQIQHTSGLAGSSMLGFSSANAV